MCFWVRSPLDEVKTSITQLTKVKGRSVEIANG